MAAPWRMTVESAQTSGWGIWYLQGSAQMLAFTMSPCPLLWYPGRSILREGSVFSSLVLLDHFICYCQWNKSTKTCSNEQRLLQLIRRTFLFIYHFDLDQLNGLGSMDNG